MRLASMTPEQRAHERFKDAVRAKFKAEGRPLPEEEEGESEDAMRKSLAEALMGSKTHAGKAYNG